MGIKNKIFFKIHSWTGITAGLMLFVICWSGTVAVFSHELDRLLNPSIRAHTSNDKLDWGKAYDVFEANYPNEAIQELSAPLKKGYAMEGWADGTDGVPFRFYIDPVTYELLGQTTYFNVQRFFRSLHMSLFEAEIFSILGVPIGYFIVGIFGFVLLLSAITGFLFYKKWRKGIFKLNIKKGARIFWSDAHKLTGIWSLWFALLMGLTGTWYLLEWWLPEPPYAETTAMDNLNRTTFLSIDSLVGNAEKHYPELNIQRLGFYDYKNGKIVFEGDDGAMLVRKRAAFISLDTRSGGVVEVQKPNELSLYVRWWETVDLMHFGKFGGLWSKWLYFIFGMGLSLLCLSGAYLQAKRQKLKTGIKSHRKAIAVSYSLTVGLLIMTIYTGWTEIMGYGSEGNWPEVSLPIISFLAVWTLATLTVISYWMYKVK